MNSQIPRAKLFKEAHENATQKQKTEVNGTIRERITYVLNNDILTVSQIATKSKTTINDVVSMIFEKKLIKVNIVKVKRNNRVIYLLTTSTVLFKLYS